MNYKRFFLLALPLLATGSFALLGCQGGTKIVNSPPSELSVTIDKCYIATGGSRNLEGDAQDDDGDSLTFYWKASAGSFNPPSGTGKTVYWIAPGQAGQVTITMTVTDGIDKRSLSQGVTVCVPFPLSIPTSTTISNQGYIYIATSDFPIVIQEGVTLTIDPGVRIVVDNSLGGFEAYGGRIVAVGTQGQPIRILGNACVAKQGLWGGIYLRGAASEAILKHVDVAQATDGIVVDGGASLTLDSCDVHDTDSGGISVVDMSEASIHASKIWDNDTGIYVRNGRVDIIGNSIRYSNQNGIELNASQDEVQAVVDHCEIAANGGDGIQLSERARPTIHNCSIFANGGASNYAIRLVLGYTATDSIHAERNFWGRDNNTKEIIAGLIFDKQDSPAMVNAYVSFDSFLTSSPTAEELVSKRAVKGRAWGR